MISVITTAFQHEKTLQKAIDSVQMQEGVEIEHIVIDDTLSRNGMMQTFLKAFNMCQGEYIAFCDGDDYWIHAQKLKRQLDYMDNRPECGLCITKVYAKRGDVISEMPNAEHVNAQMSFDTLLKGKAHINAQSYLLRKSDFDKYIDFEFYATHFNTWDYPIVLELIQHKTIHCLDFYSAVNVVNDESVTHTKSRLRRIKYLCGNYKIKWFYIRKYGCKFSTKIYLIYRILRSVYSTGAKTWK